jgi:NAD+ synthase (glutamine-hydrolysing)
MKIALAQLNFHVGNFELNTAKILEHIEKAKVEGVDLIVFSELSVCGYPPYDLLEQRDFVYSCINAVNDIATHCSGIAAIVGAPSLNSNPSGKQLFNSAYFLSNEKIQQIVNKSLLPTYDVFDEYRHFEPNRQFNIVNYLGKKIAITICEDLWDDQPTENSFGRTRLYTRSPMEELSKFSPDLVVNISASPFASKKSLIKKSLFTGHAKRHHVPLFYVNQIGANTELIFDGGSMVVNPSGNIIDTLSLFKEDFKIYDLDSAKQDVSEDKAADIQEIEKIHSALILGIRDYFSKMGFKRALLGLSGGIDSAIVAVLATEALGSENVRVLLMPSKYSSDHSVKDAIDLADNLGIQYSIVNIQPIVDSFLGVLIPLFETEKLGLTEENLQARIRGTLLMAASNRFGNLLLNTSNKSEAATGYGTLYGDMCGALSVIGDLYKTEVYDLARFINRQREIIPENTISKPPSAELRPDQKDSDSLPDYSVLDDILFHFIEMQQSLSELLTEGKSEEASKKALRLLNINEYKRFQMPPVLRVSAKAFGFGRRIPIVASLPR